MEYHFKLGPNVLYLISGDKKGTGSAWEQKSVRKVFNLCKCALWRALSGPAHPRLESLFELAQRKDFKMQILRTLFVILILSVFVRAQFVDCQAEISIERMPEQERNDLKTLEQMLPTYFESYTWFDNSYGIELPISIRIFPQSVNKTGVDRTFTSQLFISTISGDQRFFEKNFQFTYKTNDPLQHIELPHPLTSALDFYAWMFIAGEMDTYEPLAGNSAYERARDIANRAQMSDKPWGFKDRLQALDEITRIRDYRMVKYYYWLMVDLINQDKTGEVRDVATKALGHLEDMFFENARERYTHIFLDVYARDFMAILKAYGDESQCNKLIELDPDNKKVYEQILAE